jgi:hypothetical protein
MRQDYCPMANEPCQSMCDTPCSAHRLKIVPESPKPRREVTLSDEEIGTLANEHLDVGDGLCGRNFVIGEIEFARAVIAAYRAKQGETK